MKEEGQMTGEGSLVKRRGNKSRARVLTGRRKNGSVRNESYNGVEVGEERKEMLANSISILIYT